MSNSTPKLAICKPAKPDVDFPLFAHASSRWAKKIRGKLHYFGPWSDPYGALEEYKRQAEALHRGLTPRLTPDELTIRYLCNSFLTAKKQRVASGELAQRSFDDYFVTCSRIVDYFGRQQLVVEITPRDFEAFRAKLAKKWGPATLGNEIRRVRVAFNYAYKQDLLDRPVKFGEFKPPSKKVMRLERAKAGPKMFEAKDLRRILKKADRIMGAMILLGVNCGLGNMDIATLTGAHLDLKGGWLNFPRPKTGIPRRCPLWKETITAVKKAIKDRPAPQEPDHSKLIFLTKYRQPWNKGTGRANPLSAEFRKLLENLKIHRKGLSFYGLRHTFETVAGDSRDQIAVDAIMGHAREDMASIYRERINDDRLRAVVDHVRKWLFET